MGGSRCLDGVHDNVKTKGYLGHGERSDVLTVQEREKKA